MARIHYLRDSRGRDAFRNDECPCEQTDLNCIPSECTYMKPAPAPRPQFLRVVCRPEGRVSSVARVIFIVIACLLCAAATVNLAAISTKVNL